MQRRRFIQMCASGWVLSHAAPAFSNNAAKPNKKVVWVLLRGAMDSLHAVVPTFDQHLQTHRKSLYEAIAGDLKPLHDGYGMHPALAHMHEWYTQGSLLPVVAVASPYRSRSHFDAQDMLESGLDATDHDNGWLARAVNAYRGSGLAISRSVPISLRGNDTTHTWYPSSLPDADDDLIARLSKLYEDDSLLHKSLMAGIETRESMDMNKSKRRSPKLKQLARSCGELLTKSPDATCAMLEMGGWDTHNNQASRLQRQFTLLDEGLATLKDSMGEIWKDTLVVVATEFGRTVAVNGTKGTDHGTASALFLTGGAVKGGRVGGEWPGLAPDQLFEKRDLKPTTDIRSWIGSALAQHLSLTPKQVSTIFPGVKMQTQQLIQS